MPKASQLKLHNGVAVLTGAGGGIGAALAIQLADHGCHLALVDIRVEGLHAIAQQARTKGVTVSAHVLDVAQPESASEILAAVKAQHGRATLLINNAGVAVGGNFNQVDEVDFDWLMNINFGAVVRLTRAFLPLLSASSASQIVNISSIFGLIAPPGQTAYCASKFALRGFSESLRHELEMTNSPVRLSVVHPGGVRTGIAENSRTPHGISDADLAKHRRVWERMLVLSPEVTATRILAGIEKREPRILVGKDTAQADLLQRLFPARYWRLMAPLLKRAVKRK
jgi:short-subunit dehydrogenase|tara:strand:+ start:694 stop:1542 length:849 start_codon:yes stop_codon:yes gene_type:complete